MSPDVQRTACVVCGESGRAPFLRLEAYPVFQGCVAFQAGSNEWAPMSWAECRSCGSAQITTLPALDRIYQAGHATGLGAAWARHHAAFADFLCAEASGSIVDVGGGSGTLAAAYRRVSGAAPWTILEPNALRAPCLPSDVAVMDGFLDGGTLARIGATTAVMCHMLEHVVDLRATLAVLDTRLPPDGRICIAWPELENWTARGVAGALNFEHGIYLTVPRLLSLFAQSGWHLRAQSRWAENDTRFLAFARGARKTVRMPRDMGAKAVLGFFDSLRHTATRLTAALSSHDGEAFLMPASIYAQALLALGLPERRFSALLDNSGAKQGARLYGTDLRVLAPAAALPQARTPLVILNGGAHTAEIAAGLRTIRSDVRIVAAGEPDGTIQMSAA
ncbi:MAG: methyltransferase domain-containing protein [Rhizomicrobium sp.]